ncbi:MAG: radical SAM protein [bacterium]
MKVCFVYLDIDPFFPGYGGRINFGVAALSAILKERGHETSLIHVTRPVSEEVLGKALKREKPDLVGFSSTTNLFVFVEKYAAKAKQTLGVPVICGGPHATATPDEVIGNPSVDIVCVGEGDAALPELCARLESGGDISSISSLWVKQNGEVHRNPVGPLIEDLDELPLPDLDVFDYENLQDTRERVGVIFASRGCPFQCSYCVNRLLRGLYPNREHYVRYKSVPRVMEEIRQVLEHYPKTKYVVFNDDTFILKREWFRDFVEIYKKEIGLPYMCTGHVEVVDEERAALLKSSGCAKLWIGVGSGNELIRKKVLKRAASNEKILNAFRILHSHGIKTHVFNMVGIPHENKQRILDTIKLNAKIKSQGVQVTVFYPYPGTELFEICSREGVLSSRKLLSYRFGSVLNLPDLTVSQIGFFQRYFIVLTRLYSAIGVLPPVLRGAAEKIVDGVVCSRIFPYRAAQVFYSTAYTALRFAYVYGVSHVYSRKGRQFRLTKK